MKTIYKILILSVICHTIAPIYATYADSRAFNKVNQAVSDLVNAEAMAFHKKGRFFSCRYSSCEKHLRDTSSGVKLYAISTGLLVYIDAEARRGAAETVKYLLETTENKALTDSDATIFRNLYEAKIRLLASEYRMSPGAEICEGDDTLDVCRFTVTTSANNKEGVRRFSNEVRAFQGVKKVGVTYTGKKRSYVTYEFRIIYHSPASPNDESNIPESMRDHRLRKLVEEVVDKELEHYRKERTYRSCTAGDIKSPGVEEACEKLFDISLSEGESLFVRGGKNLSVKLDKREYDSLMSFEYRIP